MTHNETPGDAVKSIFSGGTKKQNEKWRKDIERKNEKMLEEQKNN